MMTHSTIDAPVTITAKPSTRQSMVTPRDAWDVAWRGQPYCASEDCREDDSQHAADGEERGRLRQRLADHVPARRAQRQTNREIMRTRRAANQQQAADVGAGDGKQHEHRREERP